ncbi:AP complex mu/sigma subunit [Penicillium cataractarum]|uniref:AP-2 complex subunit sigma n=1 Tax=Penicillium cataractarum TaxID=2100454 RepID=A0A9W9UY55_9EURO|nr:AP complex mu/sigma subunit [Penicillium cataractarum]KAJ5359485.1 AP complex mu/sigma subunit [Penicillium cataractarum]
MPVYMLHGFRWPRAGFTGIRVYIVLNNLEEAAAEYLQQPLTTELVTESLKKTQADLMPRLPELQFIEQYDPQDESTNTVSQDYAYVGAKVVTIPDGAGASPGLNMSDVVEQGSGLSPDATEALEALRDRLAPGEKIGWFMVYNGDPDRWFPPSEDEDEYEDEESYVDEKSDSQTEPSTPQSYTAVNPGNMERGSFAITEPAENPPQLARPQETSFTDAGQVNSFGLAKWFYLSFSCRIARAKRAWRSGTHRTALHWIQDEEKVKLKGEVHRLVAPRDQKYQSNFVEFRRSTKIVYRRYAGLFFCVCVDANDNELAYLEAIHFFVEVLDQFFGNVCELDLVFNFYKVYAILDEVFLAGEIEETSKQVVLTRLEHLDKLE